MAGIFYYDTLIVLQYNISTVQNFPNKYCIKDDKSNCGLIAVSLVENKIFWAQFSTFEDVRRSYF